MNLPLRLHLLLFPPGCWHCRRLMNPFARQHPGFPYLCEACDGALGWRDPEFSCRACGRITAEPHRLRCPACATERIALDRVWGACHYRDPVRHWVLGLKYYRHDPLARMMGDLLARSIQTGGLTEDVDWVVPVPLHPSRVRRRGFNQAHLLAHHALAGLRRRGRPAPPLRTDLLQRHKKTRPQVEIAPAERYPNVADAFSLAEPPALQAGWRGWIHRAAARPAPANGNSAGGNGAGGNGAGEASRRAIEGRHILLVDDVMTTGATLNACARTLKAAGARRVDALVLARA
ncbi:MAG: ComF family protein [SAR324 cluster bacterium]|nr:ComF family protein [SAR324 cluster bacterium]